MHNPSNAHETRAVGAMLIMTDVALALKGLAQRHLEV
jgi:hypothetical protein